MVKGAMSAPTDAPALNMAVAKARSFLGKYSAVTLIAAGKLPASPSASTQRHARNRQTLTVLTASPMLAACCTNSLAPSKPSNQWPVRMPAVPIPQNACRMAPVLQMPIAHR